MLGSALVRALTAKGMSPWLPMHRTDFSITLDSEVAFTGMDTVFFAAGVGGGIAKNQRLPADLAFETLRLLTGGMEGARRAGVTRFVWFACACVYPRDGGALWSGPLEPTSQAFAAAQLAGIELTRAMNQQHGTEYVAVIGPTLFGPGDDFSEDGHVVAGLIRRLHEAKINGANEVALLGSGDVWREIMFVDDLSRAILGRAYGTGIFTVSGQLHLVATLAALTRHVVGFTGEITWAGGESGAFRKTIPGGLEIHPAMSVEDGLRRTYEWFLANVAK